MKNNFKKKSVLFLFIAILILSLPIITKQSVCFVLSKILKREVSFSSISINRQGVYLHHVNIGRTKKNNVQVIIDKIGLKTAWIRNKKIYIFIDLYKPHIWLHKNTSLLVKQPIKTLSLTKNIDMDICVRQGQITLGKDNCSLPFTFEKTAGKATFFQVNWSSQESLSVKTDGLNNFFFQCMNVPIDRLQHIFCGKEKSCDLSGKASGTITFSRLHKKWVVVNSQLTVDKFNAQIKEKQLGVAFDKIKLSLENFILSKAFGIELLDATEFSYECQKGKIFDLNSVFVLDINGEGYKKKDQLLASLKGCVSIDHQKTPFLINVINDEKLPSVKLNMTIQGNDTKHLLTCLWQKISSETTYVKTSFKNITPYVFSLIKRFFPEIIYNCYKGFLTSTVDIFIYKDRINSFHIKDMVFEDVELSGLKKNSLFKAEKISGKADIDLSDGNPLTNLSCLFLIKEAQTNLSWDSYEIIPKKIQGKIIVEKGNFVPSSKITGVLRHSFFSFQLNGPLNEFSSNIDIQSCWKDVSYYFPLKQKNIEEVININMSFRKQLKGGCFYGALKMGQTEKIEDEIVFGIECGPSLFYHTFIDSIDLFWLRGENIRLTDVYFPINNKPWHISGLYDLALFYQEKKWNGYLKGEKCTLSNDDFSLYIDVIGKDNSLQQFQKEQFAQVQWDETNNAWEINTPFFSGLLTLYHVNKLFSFKQAQLSTYKQIIACEMKDLQTDKVVVKKCVVQSDLSLKNTYVDIKSIEIDGTLFQETFNSKGLGQIKQGSFIGDILLTKQQQNKWEIDINGEIKDFCLELNHSAEIKQFSCLAEYHSKKQSVDLINQKGVIVLEKKHIYPFYLPVFSKKKDQIIFDCHIDSHVATILRLKGQIFLSTKYQLMLDSQSHFFNTKIDLSKCVINENKNIQQCEIKTHIDGFCLRKQIDFLKQCGLLPDMSYLLEQIDLSKKSEILLSINQDRWQLNFETKNLSIYQQPFEKLVIKMGGEKQIRGFCRLDNYDVRVSAEKKKHGYLCHLKTDVMEGDFTYDHEKQQIHIDQLALDLEKIPEKWRHYFPYQTFSGTIDAKGHLSFVKFAEFSLDCDLSLDNFWVDRFDIKNQGPVSIYFSQQKGWNITGIHAMIYDRTNNKPFINSKIKKVSFFPKKDKWIVSSAYLQMPIHVIKDTLNQQSMRAYNELYHFLQNLIHLEKDIEIVGDAQFSSDLSSIQVNAKNAFLYANQKHYTLNNILFSFSNNQCYLSCYLPYMKKNVQIKNRIQLSPILQGEITFKEENDLPDKCSPLTIYWNEEKNKGIVIETIKGYFAGIDASFHKYSMDDKTHTLCLLGEACFDFSKIKNYCFTQLIDKLQLKRGFDFKGKVYLQTTFPKCNAVEGIITGKDFDCLSYEIKTFFAQMTYRDDILHANNLQITDPAGSLKIDQIILQKKKAWHYEIPKIAVTEFRPSLLKKVGEKEKKITPLVFRIIELNHFKGCSTDPATFEGEGSMHFINSFKRTISIFDIPAEMLGRIAGLDLDVMIPVCGKMSFILHDNKMIFTHLDEAFSENKRSKFFFVEDKQLPYIDFNGNINMQIGMKQYVLFKLTEKLIMSVSGHVSKPSFKMLRRKGYFTP